MQRKGLRRNTIDKYYTKPDVAQLCTDILKSSIPILPTDVIIEPSAGNGSFLGPLCGLPCATKAYDIAPEHPDITTQDFLVFDPSDLLSSSSSSRIHIVGNPPFGRQSSAAIQFIKKACEFATTIAFILPKSFKKDSMQRAFALNFHLVNECDLPPNSFLVDDKEHDVPCVFQVWQKMENPRILKAKAEPQGFVFVKKCEQHDIAFRRVGVNAGAIHPVTTACAEQSHYFIRFTNGRPIDENMDHIKSVKFSHDNTVGPRSISKQEICEAYCLLV